MPGYWRLPKLPGTTAVPPPVFSTDAAMFGSGNPAARKFARTAAFALLWLAFQVASAIRSFGDWLTRVPSAAGPAVDCAVGVCNRVS